MNTPKLLRFLLNILIFFLHEKSIFGKVNNGNLALTLIKRIVNLDQTRHCTVLIYETEKKGKSDNKSADFYRETTDRDILTINPNGHEESPQRSNFTYLNPLNKVKKRGANCVVSLFFYSTPSQIEKLEENLNQFVQMTTFPLLSPHTKRNEDFLVFIVNNSAEMANQILMSSHIAFRFKYKMTITISDNGNNNMKMPKVNTLCFYCNHGQPQILELSTDTKIEKEGGFFPNMLRNFNGGLIKAAAATAGPSTQMRKGKEDGIWRPFKTGGPFLRNFLTAAEALNFTHFTRPSIGGGGTGLKAKNGTWFGVVGDVLYRNVDVGAVSGITLDRFFLVEFSSPCDYLALSFSHGPSTPIYTWKSIFWPFAPSLWSATVFSTTLSIVVLVAIRFFSLNFLLDLKSPRSLEDAEIYKIDGSHEIWSVVEILYFILPSFLGQSFINARSNSFQVFSVCWLLFIIVITTVYLSKLFGFFVEPPVDTMPTNFDELADSHFQLGMTYYGGAIYSWFQNANKKTAMGKIYKRMEKRKTFDCLRDTLERKHYACISYQSSIEYAIQVKIGDRYGRSQIIMEPAVAFEIPISLTTEKRSILIHSINRVTSANFEASLTTRWRSWTHTDLRSERLQQERAKNQITPDMTDSSEPTQLNIKHFTGALTILSSGVFVSSIVFIEEMLRKFIAARFFPKNGEQKKNYELRHWKPTDFSSVFKWKHPHSQPVLMRPKESIDLGKYGNGSGKSRKSVRSGRVMENNNAV